MKKSPLILSSVVFSILSVSPLISAEAFAAPKNTKQKAQAAAPRSESHTSSASSSRPLYQGIKVRPLFGFHTMSPQKLNNLLQEGSDNNSSMKIGGGMSWGLAADYPVWNDQIYVGLRLEHFSSSSDTVGVRSGSPINMQASVSGTPLMITGTYLYPLNNWRFGATLGAGLGLGYNTSTEISNSNNAAALPNGTITYSSMPFAGLISACAGYEFTSHIGARLDAGYRLISSSQLKATDNYGQRVKEGELLRDRSNNNVTVNGSGFLGTLSLVVTL